MIRKLSPELIHEIAAGEVISGVVDVARELLENALDAEATRIHIELWNGGLDRIVVSDNGKGMSPQDLWLASESHTTSKLENLASIQTLGFRGEGLFAIRQAAQLRLSSRPVQQLGGASLIAHQDQLSLQEHPAPPGTKAEVSALFAHWPARRRSLESPAAETRKVVALLSRYLLHLPHMHLRLLADGQEKLLHAGGGFIEAARLVWGPVSANRLLPLEHSQGDLHLEGLLSRPELARPRKDRLWLAINGRPVEWPEGLLHALLGAYRELLPAGQFPVGVLNLRLPPEAVLQHTAPEKSRVRLLHPEPVVAFLQHAVAQLLLSHPLARALPNPSPLSGPTPAQGAFPQLRHLGTYRSLYLLAEANEQLYVIDQHAAHERILYEELSRRYRQEAPIELSAQELLSLTPEEEGYWQENTEALEQAGLILEPFGPSRYRIRQIPAFLAAYPSLVAEVVRGALGGSFEQAWRTVLARLACLPAIRAGHALSGASAQALLDALAACELPWVCPHGRPTALVLSELELARRFGRRGVRAVQEPKN